MPEYKRFIAYFYEYIDGKKQKSAGFAKVELRNGIWRILFRLTAAGMPVSPVTVYGFVRENGRLLGLSMGNIQPGRERTEEWAYKAGEALWRNKYSFSDLSGIWIQSGDGRSFITVWDDEAVDLSKFTDQLEEPEKGNEPELEIPKEVPEPIEEGPGPQIPKEVPESIEEGPGPQIPDEMPEPIEEGPGPQIPNEMPKPIDEPGVEIPSEVPEPIEEPGVEIPNEMPEAIPPIASMGESEAAASAASVPECACRPGSRQVYCWSGGRGSQKCRNREWNLWEELFKKRSHFQPFGEDELMSCVRIFPCDIGRMQQEGWNTGKNSFLMHGFYRYRHLMLAMTEKGKYLLGVPGIMNPQEKYMANMFGFSWFKACQTREQGCPFGYWCRELTRTAREN
ncbi:MAG TPA: hypothetical protein IAB84_05360 [Candidatus Choladousia intestinigallinarum]|nr:hypothetical protein [Candidatus Choladousia intestinigallinarum]